MDFVYILFGTSFQMIPDNIHAVHNNYQFNITFKGKLNETMTVKFY